MENRRLKIAFVWPWERASEIKDFWRDGLRAAIEEIAKKHDVHWFLGKTVPNPRESWDAILFWDDSYSLFFRNINNYPGAKRGIFLTTDPHNLYNLSRLDAVFCESDPIVRAAKQIGSIKAIKAFGTDDDFYKPDETVSKDIKYFYPATFSPWKRQGEIAGFGSDLICIGTLQPDGDEEYKACVRRGVKIELGYWPAEKIRDYYQRTSHIVIPAVHGSERTVLEAMANNIVPTVYPYNERAHSYIEEYTNSDFKTPREFILENYSYKKYAQTILEAIQND